MKKCPFCNKTIEDEEIQCWHCGEWLDILTPPKKEKKNVPAPVNSQEELKKIWKAYGNIIIAIIVIIATVIIFKVNQKAAFEKNTQQATKIASSQMDAFSDPTQQSASTQQSAPARAPDPAPAPAQPPESAEDLFKKALDMCSKVKCADPQKAIEYLDETIKLKPNLVEAYNNRGIVYSDLGQHHRAIEDYNEAIRLNPNYAHAYYNRGCSYGSLNQYQLAIDNYNEAIRLNPDDAASYYNRALANLAQGNKELGCNDAQKACGMGNCKALEEAKAKGICR
jgi:tetratricopeptide (TPR) repeat protein